MAVLSIPTFSLMVMLFSNKYLLERHWLFCAKHIFLFVNDKYGWLCILEVKRWKDRNNNWSISSQISHVIWSNLSSERHMWPITGSAFVNYTSGCKRQRYTSCIRLSSNILWFLTRWIALQCLIHLSCLRR